MTPKKKNEKKMRKSPEAALVLIDGGEAVSMHRVEVVLIRDTRRDHLRVHHVALALSAVLVQSLDPRRYCIYSGSPWQQYNPYYKPVPQLSF